MIDDLWYVCVRMDALGKIRVVPGSILHELGDGPVSKMLPGLETKYGHLQCRAYTNMTTCQRVVFLINYNLDECLAKL